MVAVQDCGLVIDMKAAESQVYGALIMGVSCALSEEKVIDPVTGRMLDVDFESYRVAGIGDVGELVVHMMTGTKAARKARWEAYASFVAAFRDASEKLKPGDRAARFPVGWKTARRPHFFFVPHLYGHIPDGILHSPLRLRRNTKPQNPLRILVAELLALCLMGQRSAFDPLGGLLRVLVRVIDREQHTVIAYLRKRALQG